MASYRFTLASALILVTSCIGQGIGKDRGGSDPRIAEPLIKNVLNRAQVSGSLAYWGRCGSHTWRPDFPKIRLLSDYSGGPREVLQELFADDPNMQVTQEPQGMIRMVETDVPSDLLNIKIRHISFRVHGPANTLNGPNSALEFILSTPEVKAFNKEKNLGLPSDVFTAPGDSGSGRRAYGELDNVTVSQALDYILQIFPGFWVYENCPSEEGGRTVFLGFF